MADVYDVIVVGAGNAGLTAALAAQQMGTNVLLIDKCPKSTRGGNTRFSGGGFRFTYGGMEDMRPMVPEVTDEEVSPMEVGTYSSSDFFEDVMQVTEYAADKNSRIFWLTIPTLPFAGSRISKLSGSFRLALMRSRLEEELSFRRDVSFRSTTGGLDWWRCYSEPRKARVSILSTSQRLQGLSKTPREQLPESVFKQRGHERNQSQRGSTGGRWFRGEPRDAGALSRARLGLG